MDGTQPERRPAVGEKVWAILGLAAALVLAGISIDLLIGRPAAGDGGPEVIGGGDPGDCGC